MNSNELAGTWTATDTPTLFTSHSTSNKLLIRERIGNKGNKEYYLLCIQPDGKRQYISTLYADHYQKLRAYNFDLDGRRYLWQKVRSGLVRIVPFGTQHSYDKLTM